MSPARESSSTILNNLNRHVESGDFLFVVSGPAPDSQDTSEAFHKRCKTKCQGRKKLNRNLHSKIIEASQFVAPCEEPQCPKAAKNIGPSIGADNVSVKNKVSEVLSQKRSENVTDKRSVELKPKRSDGSNRNRSRSRGPPPISDNKWRRQVILRQMKNHRVSSASMDSGSRQKIMIRPAEKLKALQNIFDAFISQNKWETASMDSESISGIMNRIGLSKYGFKVTKRSPYAASFIKDARRRPRAVLNIVPRHNCFVSDFNRVPSYMGWHWTKCFSEFANSGWRPGAIPRNIRDIMTYFNGPCCACMPNDVTTCVTYDKRISAEKAPGQVVAKKPTLRVVRRDGQYFVCMNPLKSSDELAHSDNPYLENCPPIKFQIALNRNRRQHDDKDLGLLGYPCSEHPAICEDNKEMQDLLNLLADECENDKEFYKLAKTLCSKPSDLDIEFIAPGANVSDCLAFQEGVYKETQYDKNDFEDGKPMSKSLPVLSTRKSGKAVA